MTTPRDCTTDAAGCRNCPQLPAVPGVPSRIDVTDLAGWNAGANSIDMLEEENVHTVFQIPAGAVGVVVGLKEQRDLLVAPTQPTHAFYFSNVAGADIVSVMEFGVQLGSPTGRVESDVFEIRRCFGVVEYLINDAVFHRSQRASGLPVLVNACLFNSGDGVE